MKHQPLIKKLRAGLKTDETGNKANSLIFLHRYGFNIPLTFLVTTHAHSRYLTEGASLLEELKEELADLPDRIWAVRSSTSAEDSDEFSFAGQFQTYLNVIRASEVLDAVIKVWESALLLNTNEYLKKTGVTTVSCAVIIQEMIPAVLAGVSFSRNPVTDQNETVIEAIEGAGEELVQKGVTPLRWRIRENNVSEGNEQYCHFHVIRQVATDTVKLRRYYGQHIDIEWVYDGRQLYYLQLRQITGRKEVQIYSNKMAREMLPGQIKPLVWSVNIPLVNGTWLGLLSEITGPLRIRPEELTKPFYYQTYFNIKTLGMIFREFGMSPDSLEQLMTRKDDGRHSFRPGFRTLRHTFRILRFLWSKLRFEKQLIREYGTLRQFYNDFAARSYEDFSPALYHRDFSLLFDTGHRLAYLNIVTPMLMTMYHKSLIKRLKKIGVDYDRLDFRQDFPGLADFAPLPVMISIREEIEALPPDIKKRLTSLEDLRSVEEAGATALRVEKFINDFGHLSDSGNDFSYPKWEEDPETVFSMILSSSGGEGRIVLNTPENLIEQGINFSGGVKRAYMKAGRFKLYREQISSLYIYGYGLFRRLFLKAGEAMAAAGVIESREDIFYLRKEEVDAVINGIEGADKTHYRGLVRVRREEMEQTEEIVLPTVIYGDEAPLPERGRYKNHSGTGTSQGTYTGITRVVRNRNDFVSVTNGDVILIPFSDVSWTPVLVKAGAIVSETGGMLSHCSIIAREMGIPAMVSVPNACAIGSGLTVTVNGSNGILTVHDHE